MIAPVLAHAQAGLAALPAHYRVVDAASSTTRITLTPSAVYGHTESVLGGNDAHHRIAGAIGLALTHSSGWGAEARVDARHDIHKLGPQSDTGSVLDPRFALRYAHAAGTRFSLLGQVGLWVPGEKAPAPSFPATTVDALLALSFTASPAWQLTASAGYRLDRSARSISQPERLSESDWLSLGLSEEDAALLGLAVKADLGAISLFAETRWDLALGDDAPPALASPLHGALGVTAQLGRRTTRATLVMDLLMSGRPEAAVTAPLAPFDPRLSFIIGISQDFTWVEPAAEAPPPDPAPPRSIDEPPAPKPAEPVRVDPAPAEAELVFPAGLLRVVVRDSVSGEALAAQIEVIHMHGRERVVQLRQRTGGGALEMDVPPGRFEVRVSAPGHVRQRRRVQVDERGVTVINVDLRPK